MNLRHTLSAFALSALVVIGTLPCEAGPLFYSDVSGGYVQMKNSAPFFGQSASGAGSGYGLAFGVWSTLTTHTPAMNFQLGIQNRYESTTNSGATDTLNLPYVAARLQFSRIYFTFGYSPYVMQSSSGGSSTSSSLSRVSDAYSLLGEAGFLLPITPRFSFSVSGAYESISAGGVKSPSPIISGSFGMRFYYDFGRDGGSDGSSEFHGWRYPFGQEP